MPMTSNYFVHFSDWDGVRLLPYLGDEYRLYAETCFVEDHDFSYFKIYQLLPNNDLRLYLLYSNEGANKEDQHEENFVLRVPDTTQLGNIDIEETHTFVNDDIDRMYPQKEITSVITNDDIDEETPPAIPLGVPYPITEVYIKCPAAHISLSKNVRNVIIDKTPVNRLNIEFFDSKKSSFEVDENNQYFCSKEGSLFSKDMKTLYFLRETGGNVEIPDEVSDVRPYSICVKTDAWKRTAVDIVLPENVTRWRTAALSGRFNKLTFKGKLNVIEDGAFTTLEKDTFGDGKIPTELYINNEISNIKYHDIDWNNFRLRNLHFVAPDAIGRVSNTGNVELTQSLSIEDKISTHSDYKICTINPFATKELKDGSIIAVLHKELRDNLYRPVSGSQLVFALKNINHYDGLCVDVLEDTETIRKLVEYALNKNK